MSDPTTDAFLARFDCTFTFEADLDLRRIDRVASTTNQSRFDPIDAETVERYTAAVEDGAEFPPVILRLPAKAKGADHLVTLGGNHRVAAHVAGGRKTIDAYLVTCSDLVALEISYADNATHGLPPTKAEQIAHALLLVETHGRSMAHAARIVGINNQQITKHVAMQGVRARAAKCNVTAELIKVSPQTQPRLSSLRDDRVFTKVIRAIAANQIGAATANRMIADINSQGDVASALDILAAHVREHRATFGTARKVGAPSTNPLIMLRTALGTIRGLNAADVVDKATTKRERDDLHDMLVAGGRHIMAIDKLLEHDRRPIKAVG